MTRHPLAKVIATLAFALALPALAARPVGGKTQPAPEAKPAPAAAPDAGTPAPADAGAPAPEAKDKKKPVGKDEKPADAKKPEEKPAEQKPAEAKPAGPATGKPEGEQKPAEPAEPPKPQLAVPIDERYKPKETDKKTTAVATEAPEMLYRQKAGKVVVLLHVRPAQPAPGSSATLLFELAKVLDIPDPAIGDRAPVENADFSVTVSSDVKGFKPTQYKLHEMPNKGIYGLHFTAPQKGVYKLALAQTLVNKEIGDQAITAEFNVGFGVPSPMERAEEDESATTRTRKGRSALKVVNIKDKNAPAPESDVMAKMGEHWLALLELLDDPKSSPGDAAAHAKALQELAEKTPGTAPRMWAKDSQEFNLYAGKLADALKDLPAVVQDKDHGKAKAALSKVDTEHCMKCHTKYFYNLTDDVSSWPRFELKEPKKEGRK